MLKKIISEVIDPLLETISPNWIDRYGGLVQTLEVKKVIDPKQPTKTQIQKYPISCSVTQEECNDPTSLYADLVPDETKSSIVYFEELNPMQFSGNLELGSQVYKNFQKWRGKTRLVVWLNAAKLGIGVQNDNYSCDWYFPYLDQLIQLLTTSGKFTDGNFEGGIYKVQAAKIAPKDLTIFNKYTYNKYVNYYRYPYEYFAIDFDVEVTYCVGSNSAIPSGDVIPCPFNQSASDFTNEYSMAFQQISQYLTAPNSTDLSFGNGLVDTDLTFSIWLNAGFLTSGQFSVILNKRGNTVGTDEYIITKRDTDVITVIFYDYSINAYIGVDTTTSINIAMWTHLAVTKSGSSILVYFDGVLQATVPRNLGTYTAMNNTTSPLVIGRAGWTTSLYYGGFMDEYSMWSAAFNQTEIDEIYNSGIPGDLDNHSQIANIRMWSRMGDGATWDGVNWTIPDNSPNSNILTSVNMIEADRRTQIPT